MTTAFSLDLNEDQLQLQKWVHDFAEGVMRPAAHEWDEREETPWPIIEEAAKIGLYSFEFVSQAFFDPTGLTMPVVNEELAWGDAGIAVSIGASGLAGTAIIAMGTEEQKQKYLTMITAPELKIAAMGLTEPNSGSDSLALETTATKVDGGYVLNGTKQFCTNGGIADVQVAFATTDKSLGPLG
ncbi:MAG TPA: acyl-CoA dehydrogenase family protein, partial [Acidimicrobiales bacterium]|nr:acyl-CoA dehydrogenase family protein [Acidimicrobiales bacterium]